MRGQVQRFLDKPKDISEQNSLGMLLTTIILNLVDPKPRQLLNYVIRDKYYVDIADKLADPN